jgi:hypothetical protein
MIDVESKVSGMTPERSVTHLSGPHTNIDRQEVVRIQPEPRGQFSGGDDTAEGTSDRFRRERADARFSALPVHDLIEAANVGPALETLALRMDGRAAAATTTRRRRAVFYNVLQYAVELALLAYNPIDRLRIRATQRKRSTCPRINARPVCLPARWPAV